MVIFLVLMVGFLVCFALTAVPVIRRLHVRAIAIGFPGFNIMTYFIINIKFLLNNNIIL